MKLFLLLLLHSFALYGQVTKNTCKTEIIYVNLNDGVKLPLIGQYPTLNTTGDTLFFVFHSKYFYTTRNQKQEWQIPELFFETDTQKGGISVAQNFVYQEHYVRWDTQMPFQDIFYRENQQQDWQTIFPPLDDKIFISRGSPTIAADNKTLYFSGLDKYGFVRVYVTRKVDNQWQTPEALPAPINIKNYSSANPLLVAHSNTLIFTSNRPKKKGIASQGEFYLTTLQNNIWTEPILIDCLPMKGTEGTCATINPQEIIFFSKWQFYEYDKRVEAIKKDNIYLQDFQKLAKSVKNNQLQTLQLNHVISTVTISQPQTTTISNLLAADVLFNSGSSLLNSFTELDVFVRKIKETYPSEVIIEAHTDDVGTATDNLYLSQKRAETVANYFIRKGISSKIITSRGYGETKPTTPNDNDKNRARNRRVEIQMIK